MENLKKPERKKFLRVVADMRPKMQIMPIKIILDEGKEVKIDFVADVRQILVKDLGEQCMAYFCDIAGVRKVIFLDGEMQWFEI